MGIIRNWFPVHFTHRMTTQEALVETTNTVVYNNKSHSRAL